MLGCIIEAISEWRAHRARSRDALRELKAHGWHAGTLSARRNYRG